MITSSPPLCLLGVDVSGCLAQHTALHCTAEQVAEHQQGGALHAGAVLHNLVYCIHACRGHYAGTGVG
jgi:predicted metalloenzyme YecM